MVDLNYDNQINNMHLKYGPDPYPFHMEAALIASTVLGFTCSPTVMDGDLPEEQGKTFYQITPDPYKNTNPEQRLNLQAFNAYFYENYGKRDDRCFFDICNA